MFGGLRGQHNFKEEEGEKGPPSGPEREWGGLENASKFQKTKNPKIAHKNESFNRLSG